MSSEYIDRIAPNIVPLSVSEDVYKALTEWEATGLVVDHEAPDEVCKLCDNTGLRYHFKIENSHTGNTLMVGSQCILRFNVKVRGATKATAKRTLGKWVARAQRDTTLKTFSKVRDTETDAGFQAALVGAVSYYNSNGVLTPNHLALVRWRAKQNGIDLSMTAVKVSFKKKAHKQQALDMDTWRLKTIWDALSPSQKRTLRVERPETASW